MLKKTLFFILHILFLPKLKTKNTGLLRRFIINFTGKNIIFKILTIIFFIIIIRNTNNDIINLLIVFKYSPAPINIPANIYHLISPSLNFKLIIKTTKDVIIQKKISSRLVVNTFVFINFLDILNVSNKKPVKTPQKQYTANKNS